MSNSPLSDALKKAILESGEPLLRIQEKTGVQRASLSRFLRGERSLRLDLADKLAAYFGITVKQQKKG